MFDNNEEYRIENENQTSPYDTVGTHKTPYGSVTINAKHLDQIESEELAAFPYVLKQYVREHTEDPDMFIDKVIPRINEIPTKLKAVFMSTLEIEDRFVECAKRLEKAHDYWCDFGKGGVPVLPEDGKRFVAASDLVSSGMNAMCSLFVETHKQIDEQMERILSQMFYLDEYLENHPNTDEN